MKTDTNELRRLAGVFSRTGFPDVAANVSSAADELDRLRAKADLCKWEAEHQQGALQALGLAEEFRLGCDSIEWVGQALLDARRELDRLRGIKPLIDQELINAEEAYGHAPPAKDDYEAGYYEAMRTASDIVTVATTAAAGKEGAK